MLDTLVVVLLLLWILGMVSSHSLGGLIHLLAMIALVMILLRVIKGRRIVP